MTNVRITPFEGNYYIRKKYLKTDQMRVNYLPGLCIYTFLYVWMDLHLGDGSRVQRLGLRSIELGPLDSPCSRSVVGT